MPFINGCTRAWTARTIPSEARRYPCDRRPSRLPPRLTTSPPRRTHLNRALSKLGLCSRGMAERWIAEGRVYVNDRLVTSPLSWVDLDTDRIRVEGEDGTPSRQPRGSAAHVYLAMHKPAGYVTSRRDERGRSTVYDLLPADYAGDWLFPVGRLDRDSEGLLLFTSDGAWSNRLTEPRSSIPKVYRVRLDARATDEALQRFRDGILLDGVVTRPATVVEEGGRWYRVTLTEGRNRQIRRMFRALGYRVERLVRVAIGALVLDDLAPGQVRSIHAGDIEPVTAGADAAHR